MKAHYTIFTLFLSLSLFVSCMDDSRDFQKFDYNPEDYPDPADSPYHVEDYHILKKTLDLPQVPHTYSQQLPQYVLEAGLEDIEIDKNKATLGRVLFYDKSLSQNGTISCASCHKQSIAFSDNQKLSAGFRGKETKRNSFPLGSHVSVAAFHRASNGVFGKTFLWDLSESSVKDVSTLAFTSPIEMGLPMDEVLEKVKSQYHYTLLYKAAFGTEEINEQGVLIGLESFVGGIGSYESRFDEGMIAANGDIEAPFGSFNESENKGKELYVEHCGICHGQKLVKPQPYGNNGLELIYTDNGIGERYTPSAFAPLDQFFKVPNLRNVALTAPYMHDGRMESLREVIEFYSTGIQDHEALSSILRDNWGPPVKFNFTESEIQALVDFMHTLTDEKLLTYEKYADPFK